MAKKAPIARAGVAKTTRSASRAKATAKPRGGETRPPVTSKAAPKRRVPNAQPAKPAKATSRKSGRALGSTAKPPASSPPAAAATERRRRFPEALRLRSFSASLTVNDLQRSLDFYTKGLGFTVQQRWERDGKLGGVMLVAGSCEIGLTQDDWSKGRARVKGTGVSFYAETSQSLELIATLARENGIEVDGPKKASWGAQLVEIIDPDGFKLSICWPM